MPMFISELARLSAASPKAIRMYEALGLLGGVKRQGAYRIYTAEHLLQVKLIRQAQALGFKLAEMAAVLRGTAGTLDWLQVAAHLDEKRAAIREEMQQLCRLEAHIGQISADIRACPELHPASDLSLCATPLSVPGA